MRGPFFWLTVEKSLASYGFSRADRALRKNPPRRSGENSRGTRSALPRSAIDSSPDRPPQMHALFFSAKRAHQRTLAQLREVVASFGGDAQGLTPARFDMLFAIRREKVLCQSALCRILGVTGATVSRMARSLERLGFISRTRSTVDRRRLDIQLTPDGAAFFACALTVTVENGLVDRIARYSLKVKLTDVDCTRELIDVRRLLHRMRYRFNDVATVLYPWSFPRVSPPEPQAHRAS